MPKGLPKDTSVKRNILHRLKIARGHMDKVIAMVEQDDYCIDVIHQSQAVQKALQHADNIILENHLRECVSDAMKKGKSEESISEVMNVFKKSN
jgi:CsoR family transcriptional regulator, copper-sensing transcriptional repressor